MWRDLALVQIFAHFDLLAMRVIHGKMLAVHRSLHLSLIIGAARCRMMLVLRARFAHRSAGATSTRSHHSRVVLHIRGVLRVLHDLLGDALLTSNAGEILVLFELSARLATTCRVELERQLLARLSTSLRDKLEARALAHGAALLRALRSLRVVRRHHGLMHNAPFIPQLQPRRLLCLRRRRKVAGQRATLQLVARVLADHTHL